MCKGDALQVAASNLPCVTEAGESAAPTNNDSSGSMPGTPTRSSLEGESLTLEAADTGNVEEAEAETGRGQARTPPPLTLPSASAAHDGSHDWVAGQP